MEKKERTSVILVEHEFEYVFPDKSSINYPTPYGSGRVSRTQESDRGVIGEIVHSTQYFAKGSISVASEEEGCEFTFVYGLQAVKQNDDQEQVSSSEN